MDCAYYVTARAMTCTGLLGRLFGVGQDDNRDTDEEHWILILLHIAAGLDWKDCLRFNVQTIGLAGLLLACMLRSSKVAVGEWVENWLEHQSVWEATYEGSFPILQILQALRCINTEWRCSRDVLALYQPVDDAGGRGKANSYASQTITSFLVFGRCRLTGHLYHRRNAVRELRALRSYNTETG
jgi:hypothetical protein